MHRIQNSTERTLMSNAPSEGTVGTLRRTRALINRIAYALEQVSRLSSNVSGALRARWALSSISRRMVNTTCLGIC